MTTVSQWVVARVDAGPGDIAADRGHVLHWCEAVENANPIYWDSEAARQVTDGWIAPPTMLSVWMRPLMFDPRRTEPIRPLELHFRLKDAFDLPEGIVTGNEITFGEPVRMGDVVSTVQSVREISDVKANRLGTGRSWTIDVTYTNQHGAVVGVESYHMFSYRREAS
jgi:uncharacterized protein